MIRIEKLTALTGDALPIEVVERKGLGHPDTICDILAEELSNALCRFYLDRFGSILHHNVDKGLLFAGQAKPTFGGGQILEPFEIFLVGRATLDFKGIRVPIEGLVEEILHKFFSSFHALDVKKHVRWQIKLRPGSTELVELFLKQFEKGFPLANDTSVGIGFAPLSQLEKIVLKVEKYLNRKEFHLKYPALGQDIKVMGWRQGREISLIVACALIDRYLEDLDEYLAFKDFLSKEIQSIGMVENVENLKVKVNAADDPQKGDVYLTVTGTSAEAGDDGEVGRGNRANGLITPMRPMSLEAIAGKNPVSHVGKIYNLAAQEIAQKLIETVPEIVEAQVLLLSRIGAPITQPELSYLKLKVEGDFDRAAKEAREILVEELKKLPFLWKQVVLGKYFNSYC